jgi:arylsulfatase A-like enzyme
MEKKTNVVILIADHFRADALGHLGNPASPTPRLDALARAEAVSFSNVFCQNPVCTPSRCSIMSGRYPHVRGHRTMRYELGEDEPCFLRNIKRAGWHVFWGGKNDFADTSRPGWEEAFADERDLVLRGDPNRVADRAASGLMPPGDVETNAHYYSFYRGALPVENLDENGDEARGGFSAADYRHVRRACEYIESGRYGDKPFCAYVAIVSPHPPYMAEQKWLDRIDRKKLPGRIADADLSGLPAILGGLYERMRLDRLAETDWDDIRQCYLAMCARVDHWAGMLVDSLKRAGKYDDTVFVFMSDHGDFTGDYGLVEKTQNTFEDCLTHVPLIIKPAKGTEISPGIRDALVENTDFVSTMEELLGMPKSCDNFSRSLVPLLAWHGAHRDAVFCEGGRRRGEYQASEHENLSPTPDQIYWPRLSMQAFEGEPFYHSKGTMLRTKDYKYVARIGARDELYDLGADPGETQNRIDDPALGDVLAGLRERMLRFYVETADVVPPTDDERAYMRARDAR